MGARADGATGLDTVRRAKQRVGAVGGQAVGGGRAGDQGALRGRTVGRAGSPPARRSRVRGWGPCCVWVCEWVSQWGVALRCV